MNTVRMCPTCEKGHLIETPYDATFTHRGASLYVDQLTYYKCDSCSAEAMYQDQILNNHILVAKAKRKKDECV